LENEMKALAEGLALFLNPDITLSGIFKDGFSLFKFADRFYFALPKRNQAQRGKAASGLNGFYQSFFARYAAAEAGRISHSPSIVSAFAESLSAPQSLPLLKAEGLSAAAPIQGGFFTELPLRERSGDINSGEYTAKSAKAAAAEEYEIFAAEEKAESAKTDALPTGGIGRAEINRIGDALGEQLHQRLAAGFPMYVR